MARTPNPTPSLRRHKSSGLYYIHLAGKRHYLGRDREEAERQRKRIIAENLLQQLAPADAAPDLLVAEALAKYQAHFLSRCPDPRQRARVVLAIEAVCQHYADSPVAEFDQLALQRVRAWLVMQKVRKGQQPKPGEPDRRQRLSRTYVNHLVNVVKTAWTWLVSQKMAPNGSDLALRSVRSLRAGDGGRETPRIVPVEEAVVEATLKTAPAVIADMIRLQQLTGMRPGELVVMRPVDISREPSQRLELPGTKPPQRVGAVVAGDVLVWTYIPASHKTLTRGKWRFVPIGPKAQAILAPYLARDAEAYLFCPREVELEKRRVNGQSRKLSRVRRPGERYTTASYGRAVLKAVRRANRSGAGETLPEWAPNMLRHLAATEAEESGGRDVSAALLGHANPNTTGVYAEASLRKAAAYAAKAG